jgi:hypothetical protein
LDAGCIDKRQRNVAAGEEPGQAKGRLLEPDGQQSPDEAGRKGDYQKEPRWLGLGQAADQAYGGGETDAGHKEPIQLTAQQQQACANQNPQNGYGHCFASLL